MSDPVPGEALHTAFDDVSLRRYAAKMNIPSFTSLSVELLGLAASTVAVILCAERDFRMCHRRLLSDKLQVMGARVVHILDSNSSMEHTPHPDLALSKGEMIYAKRQLQLIE